MRNILTTDDLFEIGNKKFKLTREFLLISFKIDTPKYGPRIEVLEWVTKLFPNSKKVLFSENPKIFKNEVLLLNKKLMKTFDEIILSCDYGVLKLDKTKNLFDIARSKLELSNFKNCVLIDDKYENCVMFKNLGGKYININ